MSLITCKCSHSQWNHFAASGLCSVGNCSCREFRRDKQCQECGQPLTAGELNDYGNKCAMHIDEPESGIADPDAARDGILDRELGVL